LEPGAQAFQFAGLNNQPVFEKAKVQGNATPLA